MRWFGVPPSSFYWLRARSPSRLFSVKYRVQFLEDERNALDKQIDDTAAPFIFYRPSGRI